MKDYSLSDAEHHALIEEVGSVPAAYGPDFALACNLAEEDHVHARRVGTVGKAHARIAVSVHDETDQQSIFLHPAQARVLAARLLNLADELDGTTPLVFFPRDPKTGE